MQCLTVLQFCTQSVAEDLELAAMAAAAAISSTVRKAALAGGVVVVTGYGAYYLSTASKVANA